MIDLDKDTIKADLEDWATGLRVLYKLTDEPRTDENKNMIDAIIKTIYSRMNEVYKETF